MTNLLSQSESATLVVTVVEFLVTALSCRGDVLLFISRNKQACYLENCVHTPLLILATVTVLSIVMVIVTLIFNK